MGARWVFGRAVQARPLGEGHVICGSSKTFQRAEGGETEREEGSSTGGETEREEDSSIGCYMDLMEIAGERLMWGKRGVALVSHLCKR